MSAEVTEGSVGVYPQRTCLACRGVRPKRELLRLALTGGCPRVDIRSMAGGRGAYVCLNKECLSALCKKKGALSRAFRVNISPRDVKELFDEINGILDARFRSGVLDDKKDTIN